jgi:nicotinamide mononucleotide transporter
MQDIINYISKNWIEITGVVLSLIYLYLSIRQKVGLWFFGIISSIFYTVVFVESGLYADMSLQVYYIAISIYGWIHWKKGHISQKEEIPATFMASKDWIIAVIGTVVVCLLYYFILTRYTDSTVPVTDSIVGALSVVGTWMLAKKFIENWLVWIVADAICVGLYIYKDLYPTSVLNVIYTIMAGVGYWQWKKGMK